MSQYFGLRPGMVLRCVQQVTMNFFPHSVQLRFQTAVRECEFFAITFIPIQHSIIPIHIAAVLKILPRINNSSSTQINIIFSSFLSKRNKKDSLFVILMFSVFLYLSYFFHPNWYWFRFVLNWMNPSNPSRNFLALQPPLWSEFDIYSS